jgi:hypothetical protein
MHRVSPPVPTPNCSYTASCPSLDLQGPSERLTSGAGGVVLDGLAFLDEGILAGLGGGRAHEAARGGRGAQEARRGAQDLTLRKHFLVVRGARWRCGSGEARLLR